MDEELEQLKSTLDKIAAPTGKLQQKATVVGSQADSSLEAKDRSVIAVRIAGLYIAAILLVLVYLTIRGWSNDESTFDDMAEIIKIAVIPIVTLVIGYYFSKAK